MQRNKLLIWAAIVVLVAGWSLWPYAWDGMFYHAIAVGLVLIFSSLYKTGAAGRVGFWLAVSNLLDELFFDPKAVDVNEYIAAALIIAHTLWQEYRKKN